MEGKGEDGEGEGEGEEMSVSEMRGRGMDEDEDRVSEEDVIVRKSVCPIRGGGGLAGRGKGREEEIVTI